MLKHVLRSPLSPAALVLAAAASFAGLLSGCTTPAFPIPGNSGNAAEQRAQMEEIREGVQQIPLPSKSRYLAVKNLTAWENPYLTVQANMVTLHVTVADANPSTMGSGGLLRPVGARREDLNVRTTDLPSAINAIPTTAWPYGRVVAVEEAHDAPQNARPELRRNEELAMKTLNDIGVVVYEWQEGGPALH